MLTGVLYLFLSSNHLNGSIPSSLCKMQYLGYLDLAKNNLSGDLPQCWRALQNLLVLDLASNSISGTIPTSIGHLLSLRILRLSSNNFQGQITSALKYCTSLSILDLGENSLSGRIPTWIAENLTSLEILRVENSSIHEHWASIGNPGPSGIGIAFRGNMGQFLLTISMNIGPGDNYRAECMAIIVGVETALKQGWKNPWI
ncbi:hypothetical protein IFM89_039007 [Coptis chinensis]|uniref:RNase H type-1 domain-containing protein n=1 Tax=Coptis chinensis TaxID=261450 RepID=A0A835IF52_9MAGN|nr:hypothetical protein IFM89_039007 [Coptis chinensis]